MKIIESVLATTHVDRHGDRLTKEALEDAVAQTKSAYIPMVFNHDPLIPPLGRTVNAEVRELPDGEYALMAITEVFEPGDDLRAPSEDRELRIRMYEQGVLTIVYDRSYRNEDDLQVLNEIAGSPQIRLESEEKKALEPISILLLALAAGVTAFSAGFLNKMGADTWDYLKPRLAHLLARRRTESPNFLFILELQLQRETGVLAIQCILSNPSQGEFEEFWSSGLEALNNLLPQLLSLHTDVRKVVLHYQEGRLVPGFGVRKDCVPLQLKPPKDRNQHSR